MDPGSAHDNEPKWDATLGGYVTCARNKDGHLEGPAQVHGEDGSLSLEGHFVNGERHGVFRSYHPGGELASLGRYERDHPTGTFSKFAADSPGAIPLRSCCVPRGARELRIRYQDGQALTQSFHDVEGRPLGSDGTLWPEPPENLHQELEFDEGRRLWLERGDGRCHRYFDLNGKLTEETRFQDGRLVEQSVYDSDEKLVERTELASGQPHGAYYRAYRGRAPYADPAIRAERGNFTAGRQDGAWQFLGADNSVLHEKQRGRALTQAQVDSLCDQALHAHHASDFLARSASCLEHADVRSALWWMLRATGRSGSTAALRELCESLLLPTQPGLAAAWHKTLGRCSKLDISQALDALLAGAPAIRIVHLLVALLPDGHAAALDFAHAAVALSETESDETKGGAHAARSLQRLQHGDLLGALADAEQAQCFSNSPNVLATIHDTRRGLFEGFSFQRETEKPAEANAELPKVHVEQSIDAVRQTLSLYATRLSICRERIVAQLQRAGLPDTPGWLPPELESLMPTGRLQLRQFSTQIEDEDEQGNLESSEVQIDEAQGLDAVCVRGLLQTAHADWDALCWLCWSVGLSAPALPDQFGECSDLAAQVNQAMLHCYRAHDQLRTGGLVSRSKQLASFQWLGKPLEQVQRTLLPVLARKLIERRAMFFWLMFAENLSPYQSDLRAIP